MRDYQCDDQRDDQRDHDRGHDPEGQDGACASLPAWAQSLLLEPVPSRSAARSAIMERVRRESAPRRTAVVARTQLSAPMRPSRWNRRGLLTPFGTAALASLLALVVGIRGIGSVDSMANTSMTNTITASATVLRDTVLPVASPSLQDAFRAGLRDTLRVVELVLRGPDVQDASVVGDFNAWQRGATAMQRRADGAWYAQVIVPRDVVRFAYVVNTRAQPSRASGNTRVRIDSI
ncbi:MAG: hypothetical protein V4617_08890 [Gemmatimonadota bacterium]